MPTVRAVLPLGTSGRGTFLVPYIFAKKSNLKSQLQSKTKAHAKANSAKVALRSIAAGSIPNDLVPALEIKWWAIDDLRASRRRTRRSSAEHVSRAIESMRSFGMVSPIIIRRKVVVDGHTRLAAARELGLKEMPCIDVSHLTESQTRMLAISLNRLAELGEWDLPELKLELEELELEEVDLSLSFFSPQELDIVLSDDEPKKGGEPSEEHEPPLNPISVKGDLWLLGKGHRVLCGDALDPASYQLLLEGKLASAVLTDPPYNVKIAGNVSGKSTAKEFQFASGEMTRNEFHDFLRMFLTLCAASVAPRSVVYAFMDWRSIDLLMDAARDAGLEHINTAIWYKGSGSMGSFLRSAHEMCGIFCKGASPRLNNVELGKHGRDRTNVWVYPGANKPGSSSAEALKDHPTPKNVEMCADALLDVTVRGDIVLDPFLGSGTTLLAAERTRRLCYAIELEPGYVDVSIRRWQELTGKEAVLAATGQTFSEVEAHRGDADDEEDDHIE